MEATKESTQKAVKDVKEIGAINRMTLVKEDEARPGDTERRKGEQLQRYNKSSIHRIMRNRGIVERHDLHSTECVYGSK